MELRACKTMLNAVVGDNTPAGVADVLRQIADAIEEHDLCLIGLWSTGFGQLHEAVIQVVFDADNYDSAQAEFSRANGEATTTKETQ